jgi:arylsulfatase A-like enzyme
VPLAIITGLPAWSEKAKAGAERNFNYSSHYNIFPTILAVLGYSDPKILATYGYSLFEDTHDPMTFNYKYYARFGQAPLWKKITVPRQEQRQTPAARQ